jgi:hyperosmotically inducible periplasmic protein
MRGLKFARFFSVAALFLSLGFVASARPASARAQQNPEADNTKTNSQNTPTADQQKMNPADRELTRKIRRAIVADKSLSTYAHNVKIITQDGKVTLKGPVRSDDEKNNVVAKATQIAGDGNVTDQIEIKPSNK